MPILLRAALLSVLAVFLAESVVVELSHAGSDRRATRSSEMAMPDPYLDPSWPALDGPGIPPEESDSVEEVPLEELAPDTAEQEERKRYELDQAVSDSQATAPQAGDASQESDADDGVDLLRPDGYDDPAEW